MKNTFITHYHHELLFKKILQKTSMLPLDVELKSFPDGESWLKLNTDVSNADVWIVTSLYPNPNLILPICFLSRLLKEKGCRRVGLLAPYLVYMRQDKEFTQGEAVTSRYFAELISYYFDALVTVDPHLHRYQSLSEIYTISSQVVHAAEHMALWLQTNIKNCFLIGPDEESEQWVAELAHLTGFPYTVFKKQRQSSYHVEITPTQLDGFQGLQAILIDDMISTGHTLMQCAKLLSERNFNKPWCLAVHGLFTEQAWNDMKQSGFEKIVSCNTIEHDSNQIDLSGLLSKAIEEFVW